MSEVTLEELQKKIEEQNALLENLSNSKKRVEEENQKYKKRAQDAEDRLSQADKAKLEEENKLHELLKLERQEKEALVSENKGLKSKSLSKELRARVAEVAKDAIDVTDILRVAEAKEALKIDEDALTVDGVEDFVTKVRELKPHLFKKAKSNTGESNPPNKENGKGESLDEQYRRELRAARSQKDFDKVREKYGKSN